MIDKTKYNPVTPNIIKQLKEIVGDKYVIHGDEDQLQPFSHDEIPGDEWAHMPEVVIRPKTAEEIAQIVKLANNEMIPVTPRGAGSGLSGGAVPIYGGIVIYVDRMNKIIDFDKKNMMIVVEPGVIANDINEFLHEHDLFYAGYPMSMETCFIGGNVAENAGGGKAVKYGVTSKYVLGVEVVTPTGEIIELGGKLLKDVTGYNMTQLMIGSEGTLCLFTSITLKLLPLPKYQVDLLCLFKDSEEAIGIVPDIMTSSGIIPTSIEFMDTNSVKTACDYLNESFPYEQAGAMLIITVDGSDEARVEQDYEKICEFLMKETDVIEIYVADNPTTSERIWKVRRSIPEAYGIISKRQCGEDIVVPPASIPAIIIKMGELAEKYKVMIPCYGHAGDGNIHARVVSPPEWDDALWKQELPKLLDELYKLVKEFGGRLSGEHGIGHKRKKYMHRVVSESYLEMLRTIKRALDPNCILNPGKIFDM